MATFLFWNTKGKRLEKEIAALCREHDVDVLMLAEYSIPDDRMLIALNDGEERLYSADVMRTDRGLMLFSRFPQGSIVLERNSHHFFIRQLVPPIGQSITIAVVHLPSKMYENEGDQAFHCRMLVNAVAEIEAKLHHDRTVIVGDLNMNPFEEGAASLDGLNAVMDGNLATQKRVRRKEELEYPLFYNPMWSLMGDLSKGPSGTYFYNSGHLVNYYWNIFDQVMIRPSLISAFIPERLAVLTTVAGQSLLNSREEPDQRWSSDHLPLLFELQIER